MAYPAGIITRPVTFGPAFELEDGEVAGMTVAFKATRPGVLWTATGSPAVSVAIVRNADDGVEQTVNLPVTNQDGWSDGDGNAIIPGEDGHVFLYSVEIVFTQGGRTIPGAQPRKKTIAVPMGDGPLDLDSIIPLTSPGGTVVSVPDIWSGQVEAAQAAAAAAEAAVLDSAAFVGSEIARAGSPAEASVAAKITTGVSGKQDTATLNADVASKVTAAGATRTAVDGRVTAAVGVTVAPVKASARGNRAVFAGTSITAGNEGGTVSHKGPSYPNYVGLLSAGRIEVQSNAGRPGYRIDQLLGVFDTDVTPFAPSLVFIEAGTNDATAGVDLATYAGYYQQYIAKIRAIGARPVIILSPPNNATTARKTLTIQYKAWLRQYAAAQGIDLVDLDKALIDTATGAFLAALTSDGTHPKNGTNPIIAQAIVDQIVPTLPAYLPLLPTDNTDPHNLVTNGLFVGTTSGTGGAGGTLIPAGWSRNGARNAAVTGSLVTGDTAIIGNWWRLEGAGGELDFQALPAGKIVPGHRYLLRHRVKASGMRNANSGDGASLTTKVVFNGASSGTSGYDIRALDTVSYDIPGAASVAFVEFVAPVDAASLSLQFSIAGTNITAMACQIAQVGVYDLTAMGLAA